MLNHAKFLDFSHYMLPFKPFLFFPYICIECYYLMVNALWNCPPSPQKKKENDPEKRWKKEKTSPIWMLKRKFPITLKKIVEVNISIINLLTKFLQFFKLNYDFWNTFVSGRPLRHSPLGNLAHRAEFSPSTRSPLHPMVSLPIPI